MKEIRVTVRIDSQKNIMGIIEERNNLGFIPGSIEEILFMMGLYKHLANQQALKMSQKGRFGLPPKKGGTN